MTQVTGFPFCYGKGSDFIPETMASTALSQHHFSCSAGQEIIGLALQSCPVSLLWDRAGTTSDSPLGCAASDPALLFSAAFIVSPNDKKKSLFFSSDTMWKDRVPVSASPVKTGSTECLTNLEYMLGLCSVHMHI